MGLYSVLACYISSECRLDVYYCALTHLQNIQFLLVPSERKNLSKSTKNEHKPIYFLSKPSTKMADNKAINVIKAHASCDHERAPLQGRITIQFRNCVMIENAHFRIQLTDV